MKHQDPFLARCSIHGKPTKRDTCPECNRVYMRNYLRLRRLRQPEKELWSRAKKRAKKLGVPFELAEIDVKLPKFCPALGIKLDWTNGRSDNSPSLDRIVPRRGYVPGNIRVISDRANRLKGDKTLAQMRHMLVERDLSHNAEQWMVYAYMQREYELGAARSHLARAYDAPEGLTDLLDKIETVWSSYGEITSVQAADGAPMFANDNASAKGSAFLKTV